MPNSEATRTAKEIEADLLKQNRTYHVLLIIGFLIIAGGLLFGQIRNGIVLQRSEEQLEILKRATGPQAQKDQQKVVEDLLMAIDCNNRKAIQGELDRIIDGLVDTGLLPPDTIRSAEDVCGPSTTTTTRE